MEPKEYSHEEPKDRVDYNSMTSEEMRKLNEDFKRFNDRLIPEELLLRERMYDRMS